jgi:CRP-like cAMP-binding protein
VADARNAGSKGTSYEREGPRPVSIDADDSLRDRLDAALAAGQAILRTIAIPLSQGWTKTEIASGLGTSKRSVSYRMGELRHEIERLG